MGVDIKLVIVNESTDHISEDDIKKMSDNLAEMVGPDMFRLYRPLRGVDTEDSMDLYEWQGFGDQDEQMLVCGLHGRYPTEENGIWPEVRKVLIALCKIFPFKKYRIAFGNDHGEGGETVTPLTIPVFDERFGYIEHEGHLFRIKDHKDIHFLIPPRPKAKPHAGGMTITFPNGTKIDVPPGYIVKQECVGDISSLTITPALP